MKLLATLLLVFSFSFSEIRVVATYHWIGDLVRKIGGDRVKVSVISDPRIDPHFIPPKPSFIAKLRRADLLVINGAGLEDGFLPPLLKRSANPKIQKGSEGYLDLSRFVQLIEKPKKLTRALGDIHPYGNPHYHLDPENIPVLADAIKEKLCSLEPPSCEEFEENLRRFLNVWEENKRKWHKEMETLKGTRVISYHSIFNYFIKRYGLVLVNTIEPKPGIPPSPRHLAKLLKEIEGVKLILQDVYHEKKSARWLSERTGAKVVILPHDVGSVKGAEDIISLFGEIVRRLKDG